MADASRSAARATKITKRRIEKIQGATKQLIRTLRAIRARLDDAEQMEVTGDFARHWLRELEGVAHDAEDLLDVFSYEAMRLGLMGDGGLTPKVNMEDAIDAVVHMIQVSYTNSNTLSHENFALLNDVEQRIQKINSRYGEIMKHKQALWSEESYGKSHVETLDRQPTSSLIEEARIFGRERDLETVKKFLLSDAESSRNNNVLVMAIVGMGGLGKTTLAQHVYNDNVINKHFQLKSWVCVSEDFDLVRLTKAMVQSFYRDTCGISELDTLQVKLQEKLAGQRFLLVLDDVWEVKNLSGNWDRLTAPLRFGSAGSKIIITTRSEKVSKMTRATSTHHLPCLQDGDCLKLFSQQAFDGRDSNLYPKLMATGEKIAEKCKGLPLVAKTLGGLLHTIDDVGMWNGILESNVWNMNEGNEIMSVLRLSYQHLPAHLKRCFRYCSVFPKDYPFDKDRLVWMWMAHGYIKPKEGKLTEDIGREYFDDLLSRSFFQYSEQTMNERAPMEVIHDEYSDDLLSMSFSQYLQRREIFLMHDLIHDLARFVSEGECYSVEGDKACSAQKDNWHLSIISRWAMTLPEHTYETKILRSFLLISCSSVYIKNMEVLNDLFTRMKQLRVLDLSNTMIVELPNSIGCLKHVRYLGLRHTLIRQLPESVGSLYHLQALDLEYCHIECLPDSMSNLKNLRHLLYEGSLTYPVGFGKLTNLQTMPCLIASIEYGHAKIGELKDINNIRSLTITKIDNLTDVDEAKKACLEKKEHLWALDLQWGNRAYSLPTDDEVLESLRPCPQLKRLRISSFYRQTLPSWLGDPSFSKLSWVKLDNCQNWTSFPPLGQLPSLKRLFIKSAHQVNYIGHEFFSGGFPQLEILKLEGMDNWKSWCGALKGECRQLWNLHIEGCKHLESLSVINLDALQRLKFKTCPELQFSLDSLQLQQLPSLQEIDLQGICGVGHIHGVFSCGDARSLDTSRLKLENVGPLEAFSVLGECPHICQLIVTRCANLASLPLDNLTALKYLRISECPQLQFSNVEQLSATLQVLSIHGCPSVIGWCKLHRQRLEHLRQVEIEDDHLVLQNLQEAANVDTHSWTDLNCARVLELEWGCRVSIKSSVNAVAEERLEKLRPSDIRLGKLVIRGYMGRRFPSWFGHQFYTLFSVTLLQCSQCVILPPLGHQPNLIKIYVEGAHRLRHIGHEFSDAGSNSGGMQRRSFLALTKLEFHDMPIWEEWQGTKEGDFPSLCKLTLKCCPKLRALPYLPPTLKELELEACGELLSLSSPDSSTQCLQSLESLRRLSLTDCPKLDFSASECPPSTLIYVALTHCPPLLTWCEGHLSMLAHIPEIWVEGIQVHLEYGKSIRSLIEDTGIDGEVSHSS